ncbi:solute carrier organic anion transporter family member 2B1, partial [Silurus meridionalis]
SPQFFVLCHGLLQLAQLLVSGYLKGSISTIEKRYGLSSQMSGLLASFNEVGNTVLIVFVSYFGSRVHRPRCIGIGALIASMAAFLIALPHFFSGRYQYTDHVDNATEQVSGLCEAVHQTIPSNQTCSENKSHANNAVFPILLLGQLLLGIGAVPIQPFGISYIDDYADKKNSPFYLGILFALTVLGPAMGYLLSSVLLRVYVDFNIMLPVDIVLERKDPRWVGAWWMGFLLAGTLLFLTSLPYLFFPRSMIREVCQQYHPHASFHFIQLSLFFLPLSAIQIKLNLISLKNRQCQFYFFIFLYHFTEFPVIMLRTLRNPIYLLVVLGQVNLAAMVAGLATFMPKYIERQFGQTASFSNVMIGGLNIPSAIMGIIMGGVILRRLSLSVKASAFLCSVALLLSITFAMPLLFLGCSTQNVAVINPTDSERQYFMHQNCSLACSCSDEAYNPVCGSDGVEFLSPCHAGCKIDASSQNYTNCACVGPVGSPGSAVKGPCGNNCSHLLIPFMVFSSLTCFLASLCQTPSFMMILRTVTPEDKSFALGIQYMLFRVLAFLPAPVLYGSAIDSTCIQWGKKCNKNTSCQYYNLDYFRQRFLGLQTFFVFGGLVFFVLSFLVLRRTDAA